MKTFKRLLAILLAIAISTAMTPQAMASQKVAKQNNLKTKVVVAQNNEANNVTGTVNVIVQLEGDAVLSPANISKKGIRAYHKTTKAKQLLARVINQQEAVKTKISGKIGVKDYGYSYTNVINGFSMTIDADDIDTVKNISGVKDVYISNKIKIDDPVEGEADNANNVCECCEAIGASYMHKNGYSGQGQVVAVIDTELDVNHEFFSGSIENPRYTKADIAQIIADNKFNTNVTADKAYRSEKIPFAYNYSKNSKNVYSDDSDIIHGSHVSGIAVGNNGTLSDGTKFTGVAPDAQLAFFAVPELTDEQVIAALDDAAKLDVDSINCSFGSQNLTCDAEQEAFENARKAGIYVSCAAGNEEKEYTGKSGLKTSIVDYSTGGSPQYFQSVTSVASSDSSVSYFEVGNMSIGEYDVNYFSSDFETVHMWLDGEEWEFVDCGYGLEEDFEGKDLYGKIAVVQRGVAYFADMQNLAVQAGAEGLIIINNEDTEILQVDYEDIIPVMVVASSDKDKFSNVADKITISSEENLVEILGRGGAVSSFSSYATMTDLELKPDITAPGGDIYSSYPNNKYKYASGTSMATPHLAGAAALLDQYVDDKYPDAEDKVSLEQSLMMSTASICFQEDGVPYSPRVQGAGLVNLENAANTEVYLEGTNNKASISLKDNLTDEFKLKFTAHNLSESEATYDNISLYVEGDNYYEEEGQYYVGDGSRKFSFDYDAPDSVTVPAESSKEIEITVRLDSSEMSENMKIFENGFFVEGFVVLKSSDQGTAQINIPYMGFYGDWTQASMLDEKIDCNPEFMGTYLASDFYDSTCGATDEGFHWCQPLGTNLFGELDESALEKNFSDMIVEDFDYKEENAAISPNGDGMYDFLCVSATLLRNISKYKVDINDREGNIVYTEELDNEPNMKSMYQCIDIDFSDKKYADGDYTATITTTLLYEREKEQSITLPLYIDTVAPTIEEAKVYTEAGRKYLEMRVSDNKQLMGVEVYDILTEGDNFYEYEKINGDAECKVTLDITSQRTNAIECNLVDYAFNQTIVKVSSLEGTATTTTTTTTTTPPETTSTENQSTSNVTNKIEQTTQANNNIAKAKIKSAKNIKKKSIKIKFNKLKNAKKYQIQYSTSKKFKKAKTKTTSKTTYTIKKLKKGKSYFIRVRGINKNKVGKWSKAKRVIVKK